jgi:hypothetical protein
MASPDRCRPIRFHNGSLVSSVRPLGPGRVMVMTDDLGVVQRRLVL